MFEVLVGLHEGLLQHVFGIFAVLGDVLGETEDLALVTAHQFPEGPGIAFASLCDECSFVDSGLAGDGHGGVL